MSKGNLDFVARNVASPQLITNPYFITNLHISSNNSSSLKLNLEKQ